MVITALLSCFVIYLYYIIYELIHGGPTCLSHDELRQMYWNKYIQYLARTKSTIMTLIQILIFQSLDPSLHWFIVGDFG